MTSLEIPVIAVDGPAASGKGTVAAGVARALGFHQLDSGALYRLVTLAALDGGIALDDEQALANIARDLDVAFGADGVRLAHGPRGRRPDRGVDPRADARRRHGRGLTDSRLPDRRTMPTELAVGHSPSPPASGWTDTEVSVRFRRGVGGTTRVDGALCRAPVWFRWDGTTLWLVGSGASPVGEDRVRVHVDVGPGVTVAVRSVAATVEFSTLPSSLAKPTSWVAVLRKPPAVLFRAVAMIPVLSIVPFCVARPMLCVAVDRNPAAVFTAPLTAIVVFVSLPSCSATPMFCRAVARKPAEVLTVPLDITSRLAISPAMAPLKARPRAMAMEAWGTTRMMVS